MDGPLGAIIILAVIVVLFFICRAIVLWYWRVNEGIALLKSIDERLGRMMQSSEAGGAVLRGLSASHAPVRQVAPIYADNPDGRFEKWLATRNPPLVNLTAAERAYYRQSWEASQLHDKT